MSPSLSFWNGLLRLGMVAALCSFGLGTFGAYAGVVVIPPPSLAQRNVSFHAPKWTCEGNVPEYVLGALASPYNGVWSQKSRALTTLSVAR